MGKCVILPPSADENGLRYEWISLVKPAPLPAWVGQVLAERASREHPADSPKRQRNATREPSGERKSQHDRKIEHAKAFLLKALEAGPVNSKQLQHEAKASGISERTLFRAKASLHVKATRSGFGQDSIWTWKLPRVASPKTANSEKVAANDDGPGSLNPGEVNVGVFPATAWELEVPPDARGL